MAGSMIVPRALFTGALHPIVRSAAFRVCRAFLPELNANSRSSAVEPHILANLGIAITELADPRTIGAPFVTEFANALPCTALAIVQA